MSKLFFTPSRMAMLGTTTINLVQPYTVCSVRTSSWRYRRSLSHYWFHLHRRAVAPSFQTEFFILMDVVLGLNLSDVVKEPPYPWLGRLFIAQAIAHIIVISKDIGLKWFWCHASCCPPLYSFPYPSQYSRLFVVWATPEDVSLTLSTASVWYCCIF